MLSLWRSFLFPIKLSSAMQRSIYLPRTKTCPQDDENKTVHSGLVPDDRSMHMMLTPIIRKSMKRSLLV